MRALSIYMSNKVKGKIWPRFINTVREQTRESYCGDINQFLDQCKKDILEIGEKDVHVYYQNLIKEYEEEKLQATTIRKKIITLHSFSKFIIENREEFAVSSSFQNYFREYAIRFFSIEELATTVAIEDVDKILSEAQENMMIYTIIVLFCRVGLLSTEVCKLKPNDIFEDTNGFYLILKEKDEIRYIPEDVVKVLEAYLDFRKNYEYLFYNRNGKCLNTQYIHSMMKKLSEKAGIKQCSARDLRNTCASIMYAYHAEPKQVAKQMGTTQKHIKRYDSVVYSDNMIKRANELVNLKVMLPKDF